MMDDSLPDLLLASQALVVDADRSLRRRCERGELHRVRAGVYVPSDAWRDLTYDQRYRVVVHAAARKLLPGTQFSHDSAAALWHLPGLGPWPRSVDVLAESSVGGRSSGGVIRHPIGLDRHATEINRTVVTSLARTVVDFSRTAGFMRAVVAVDAALCAPEAGSFRHRQGVRPVHLDEIAEIMTLWPPSAPGMARARKVFQFGSGKSQSAGESVSRVQFHLLGFPPPELQVPFFDADGLIGYADFYWPELDLIGEFDGAVKYLGETYRRGRTPEEVVLAEKWREDRLRRVVRAFARWDWDTARDQRKLAARLAPHGLIALR